MKLGYIRIIDVTGRISHAVPASAFTAPVAVGTIVRPATAADVDAANKQQKRKK